MNLDFQAFQGRWPVRMDKFTILSPEGPWVVTPNSICEHHISIAYFDVLCHVFRVQSLW